MAYKVFQNGYQLPASDLNNYLMNQSVMVFADSTARAAAISSPVEGMLSYLESTNSYEGYNGSAWTNINDNTGAIAKSLLTTAGDTIYATGASTPARLGIGATGALLKSTGTAPSWLGVGTSGQVLSSNGSDLAWTTVASGGMTLLSTTSLSGTTTTISGISATGYKRLVIYAENITASAGSTLRIKPNGSDWNTTNTNGSSNWYSATNAASSGSVKNSSNTVPDNAIYSGAGNSVSLTMEIDQVNSSYNKPITFVGGGLTGDRFKGHGATYFQTAVTSLVFYTDGTATFSTGTVKIYGVN